MSNSFASESTLRVGAQNYAIHRLGAVEKAIPAAARLPFSLKILLENLLRTEDGVTVRREDVEALAQRADRRSPAFERLVEEQVVGGKRARLGVVPAIDQRCDSLRGVGERRRGRRLS